MSNFMGPQNYTPYNPYNGSPYDYMGGYRNYMPPSSYAQNQTVNTQNGMMQNNQQLPIQPQQMNNNIQFALIPSREVAQNATAEKGQTIYMMNQNNPEIYMKAADGFGLQSTRYFRLVEFNPEQEAQQNQQSNQQNIDYIPRSEFNQFVTAVSAELETIKQSTQTKSIETPEVIPETIKPTSTSNKSTTKDNKK